MRYPVYILFYLLFLISCKNEKSENPSVGFMAEQVSEINLILKGYNPDKNKNFINIKVENLILPIEEQLKISNDGTVSYTFMNKNKKEILFNYENNKFSLIVSPSEKIVAELKISELLNKAKFKKIDVSGINKIVNKLILANTFYLDSLIRSSTRPSVKDSMLSTEGYKNKRISEMNEQLRKFSNYVTRAKISNMTFIDWASAQIRYRAGKDLSLYPFMGKRNKNLNAEDEYFSFVKDIESIENDQLMYHSYLNYLKSLAGLYNIMGNVGITYKYKKNELKKSWPTPYFLKVELVSQLPKGKDRELMMAYLFHNEQRISKHTRIRIPDEYSDSLKFYTNETLVAQLSQNEVVDTTSIKKLISDYDLPKKEKEELIEIYNISKGKVVFHDFWFMNCPPCMKELPNYNNLMEIAGEDVVFLMFGVYMDEKDWSETIAKFKLNGIHYLLSKNQLGFYEKYFSVTSFPHHQIINTKGQIVIEEIPEVYQENLNDIVELLERNKLADR